MSEGLKESEEKSIKSSADYKAPQGAVTEHTLSLTTAAAAENNKAISYTANAEWIILRKKEKPVAEMFHVAYLAKGEATGKRPITFVFNGGPGAASAYLHMGALGPKRVVFNPDGTPPPPPVTLRDNPESWLAFTDLVFIDPVGTGFSRIIEEKDNGAQKEVSTPSPDGEKQDDKEFYKVKRDLESLGEFIRKYLSRHKRWESPVFIAGESYGGFRVGKLARLLQEKLGVSLNGAILISPALEFTLLDPSDYDILNWVDIFPTMSAAAAFHGKSRVFEKGAGLETILKETELFATHELVRFLAQGSSMKEEERKRIIRKAARYLGLPESLIQVNGGRTSLGIFTRELLRDQRKVCGMYDATITITDPYPDRETFQGPDPTLYGIDGIFTAGINTQLRKVLELETERDYHLLSMEVNEAWKVDTRKHALESQVGATDDLRYGMVLNPHMKVLITHGYYDLVTPYYSSSRIVEHMKLDETMSKNLKVRHFPGGHMFYSWDASRKAFAETMKEFYKKAITQV